MSKPLGQRIKQVRKKAGLTQAKLAEMVGITDRTLNQYENGNRPPYAELLANIAMVTMCNPGWLLTGHSGLFEDEELNEIMNAMEEFELTDADVQAIEIAKDTARRFLKHPQITPQQVIAIGNALYALERLPLVTRGSSSEFGIVYRAGTEEFSEMRYIDFRISESVFEISKGGSVYEKAVGSDSFSEPGWVVEAGGYRNAECELDDLQVFIDVYINQGGIISASDESEIEYE